MHLPPRAIAALALVGWLALPAGALAGPLVLTIGNGRVTLSAQDVPLRQILAEWERLGGVKIVNRDRVPGALVTLELADVPEARAVEMLLRPAAGFMAISRDSQSTGASIYARIIIMPGAASPAMASTGGGAQARGTGPQQAGGGPVRPQVQRRVMADGSVVNFIENPNRPGDVTIVDDGDDPGGDPGQAPQMMRPPFGAPGRPGPMPGMTGADPDQADSAGATPQAPSATPTVPTRTLATPGLLPVTKPGQQPTPPGPPKPPGD